MLKYKHIIWDWNGTLVDDAWLCVEIMNSVLKKFHLLSITLDDYRNFFTFPVKDYYKHLGFDFKKIPFEESGLYFIKAFKKRRFDASLFAESERVLLELSSLGVSHSILSANYQKFLIETVEHYKLKKYFVNIKGLSHYFANGKIDCGFDLLSDIDCDTDSILLVGDTVHDYEVADALGVDCVLLSCGHNSDERLKETGCSVISSLPPLINLIKKTIL